MTQWPTEVERLLSRCRFFAHSRVWPVGARIHPEQWLSNFKPEELPYAAALLESFMYFSPEMVNALMTSVFQSLATQLADPSSTNFGEDWETLVQESVFTHVAGEKPNASDSGHLFVRKLRQELGVTEDRLFYHPEAIEEVERTGCHLIFVDDFVGSGQQFIHTWHSGVTLRSGKTKAFSDVADPNKVIYCPLITTSLGISEIAARTSPDVAVVAAHELTPEYGVLHPESVVWADSLRSGAVDFVNTASDRAGIGPDDDRFGFADLGLTVGFDHSVPDATVRIIYWEENGWRPLLVRT